MKHFTLALAAVASLAMTAPAVYAADAPECAADATTVALPDYTRTLRPPKADRLFHSKAVEKHIGVALSKLRLRLSRSGFFSLFL